MNKTTDRKLVNILGVQVFSKTRSEVLALVKQHLDAKYRFSLVTPNPEIVLRAVKDNKLREILNSATFAVADGVGLRPWVPVTPGRQLLLDLLSIAELRGLKVFFLGGRLGVISRTLARVREEYPAVNARGDSAALFDNFANPINSSEEKKLNKVLQDIKNFKPDLLFVALGSPKQEYFIDRWLNKLPVTGMMAVGGSLDYFSGTKPLPPKWMADLGLEWLWRGFTQKGHYKRVFKSVVIFPLRVIESKLQAK